jgi:uncharacterized membrane protein
MADSEQKKSDKPRNPVTAINDFPASNLTVLAHFYRAEVYRSGVWRSRLDVTTNWAIISATATFSYAFASARENTHIMFPVASVLVLLLLCIESRRYRFYDVWWTRARMLEAHLIVPALNPELKILQGDWREFLSNDLLLPAFKVSFWEAFARRLTSNYIWIFILLLCGWILRVYSNSDGSVEGTKKDDWVTLEEFYMGCKFALFHPTFILGFQILFNGIILVILIATWQGRRVTGEIRRREKDARKWHI